MPQPAPFDNNEAKSTATPEAAPLGEAVIVAGIIARTSADFSGRAESAIVEALVQQFAAEGLDISTSEAQRVAHDIALAPKNRLQHDD